jgi:hypothetical protein
LNLSDLANLSTFLSGIAVTASLIYLALQVHQNTKHTRALLRQGRASRAVTVTLAEAEAGMAAAIITANGGVATPERVQQQQCESFFYARLISFEDSFAQYDSGLMGKDGLELTRAMAFRFYGQPSNRELWIRTKTPGTKFTAFVDDVLAKGATG